MFLAKEILALTKPFFLLTNVYWLVKGVKKNLHFDRSFFK